MPCDVLILHSRLLQLLCTNSVYIFIWQKGADVYLIRNAFGPEFTPWNINLKIKSVKPFCIEYFSSFTGTMTLSFGL